MILTVFQMATTDYKQLEAFLHASLYNNLYLLQKFYPASKDFENIFKRDMFMKNNKSAFHHVSYYLLTVLNPNNVMKKITAWPPYDTKLENKYRCEFLSYINELKSLHESFNISTLPSSSQLILPGGFKFVKFMLVLSQVVIREHLKRNDEIKEGEILWCSSPNKNYAINSAIIEDLQKKAQYVERITNALNAEYCQYYLRANTDAEKIMEKKNEINSGMKSLQVQKTNLLEVSSTSKDTLLERLLLLKVNISKLHKLCSNVNESSKLIAYSNYTNSTLNLQNNFNNKCNSINELFSRLEFHLQQLSLGAFTFNHFYILRSTKLITNLNNKYREILKHFDDIIASLMAVRGDALSLSNIKLVDM